MSDSSIDLSALHKALAQLEEALSFWQQQPDGARFEAAFACGGDPVFRVQLRAIGAYVEARAD